MRNNVITKGPLLYHSTYIRHQRSQIHRDRKNGGYQGLRGGRMGSYCLMSTEMQFGKMRLFCRWIMMIL